MQRTGKMWLHQDFIWFWRTGCKNRSFPGICPPRGGQGCAQGWEGRSCTRVSAGALELAAVCCLPTARLAPSPASLVGKPEICISEYLIWQFCKAERSLRSRLTVAGVLHHKTPATVSRDRRLFSFRFVRKSLVLHLMKVLFRNFFVLFLKQRDISNTQQLEIKKKKKNKIFILK